MHIFSQGINETDLGRLSDLHTSESPVIYKLLPYLLTGVSLEENDSLNLFKTAIRFVLSSVKGNPGHYCHF